VFPLYRHWELSMSVFQDTITILRLGKRAVLRCILAVRRLFEKHEFKRYLNHVFVQDYCVWVQTVGNKKFKFLSKELEKAVQALKKEDLCWSLRELEDSTKDMDYEMYSEEGDEQGEEIEGEEP